MASSLPQLRLRHLLGLVLQQCFAADLLCCRTPTSHTLLRCPTDQHERATLSAQYVSSSYPSQFMKLSIFSGVDASRATHNDNPRTSSLPISPILRTSRSSQVQVSRRPWRQGAFPEGSLCREPIARHQCRYALVNLYLRLGGSVCPILIVRLLVGLMRGPVVCHAWSRIRKLTPTRRLCGRGGYK